MISYNYQDNMADCVKNIESFSVFESGEKRNIFKGDSEFDLILKNIYELFLSSRIMPAFGVSLNDETLNALKEDIWLQINFNKEREINGLPFDALLIKLEVTSGINLIRKNNGKYEGRCIYLEFDEIYNFKDIISKFN